LSDPRTIAPDARRLREAHRAGLRRASVWLGRGLGCFGLLAAMELAPAALRRAQEGLRWPEGGDLGVLVGAALGWCGLVLGGFLAAALVAALAIGALGPVDRRLREKIGVEVPEGGLVFSGLAAALAAALLYGLRGALAGAARGVDAAPQALAALWSGWLVRGLWAVGAMLIAAATLEVLAVEVQRRRALSRSAAELRAEERSS
jgi:Flp pilus assembly protein TadB